MSGNRSPAGAAALRRLRTVPLLAALGLLPIVLLLPRPGSAEPMHGTRSSAARFSVAMVVLPTFEVLQATPVQGGHEYRVWTNMKSVFIKGREYRFDKIGQTTFVVAGTEADGHEGLGPAWRDAIGAVAASTGGTMQQGAAPAGDGSNAIRVTMTY